MKRSTLLLAFLIMVIAWVSAPAQYMVCSNGIPGCLNSRYSLATDALTYYGFDSGGTPGIWNAGSQGFAFYRASDSVKRLVFGTNTVSFPALITNGTTIGCRLGDDSAGCPLTGSTVTGGAGSSTSLDNAAFKMNGVVTWSGATPTSCVGSGCAMQTGITNSLGKVTTTTTGAASIVITFSITFTHAPACWATNETTANLLRATSTTTTLTLAGVTVSGDSLAFGCGGG